jgi:chromosomal replication initiation ATPase DnaA
LQTIKEQIVSITQQVCEKHSLSFNSLREPNRFREYVFARQELMYELRKLHLKWEAIGAYLCRDHSTICHGYAAHKKRNKL